MMSQSMEPRMGEARRRAAQGLPPRKPKVKTDKSPRIISWLPLTKNQTNQFLALTKRGAWIGIGAITLLWITVRFIGPTAGWWSLSDSP